MIERFAVWLGLEPWLAGAAAAGAWVALATAPLGVALYYRRESMMTDAAAHAALPGMVLAALISGSLSPLALFAGAVVAVATTSLIIQRLSAVPFVRPDAALGAAFTGAFALGVAMLSMRLRHVHIDTAHVLFGDLLAVGDGSRVMLPAVAATVWVAVVAGARPLWCHAFDPQLFASLGGKARMLDRAALVLTGVVVVAAFEAVGVVLVVALASVPAATAHLVVRRVEHALVLAPLLSVGAVAAGLAMAVAADGSAGVDAAFGWPCATQFRAARPRDRERASTARSARWIRSSSSSSRRPSFSAP